MEVERYKMIYKTTINKELKNKLLNKYTNKIFKEEILSDDIRILGEAFVKNNKNKVKLIINNKKYKLKEFINSKEFKNNKMKINIILNKGLSNFSHIYANCGKLKDIIYSDNLININDEEFHEIKNIIIIVLIIMKMTMVMIIILYIKI